MCGAQNGVPNDPRVLYDRAQTYSKLSVNTFQQLWKSAPDSGYMMALLGDEKASDHQYADALRAYEEALKRLPKLRGIHSAIADVYVALGKPADAEAAETAEQQMGSPDCAVEKLFCDFAAGHFDDVVSVAKMKRDAAGLYWLSRSYNALAGQSYSQLDNLPDSPALHRVRAQIFRDQGQFHESAEEWRSVLKVSPGDIDARHELATSLYLSRDYKTVLPELMKFVKAEPGSANLNFFAGDGLLQSEQAWPAIPYLLKALRIEPKLLAAHASLGLCYMRVHEPAKAIPHLKAALAVDSDGSLHLELAHAYRAIGQPALAKAMMAKYEQMKKP